MVPAKARLVDRLRRSAKWQRLNFLDEKFTCAHGVSWAFV
jgi:hypothetical protein